MRSTLGYGLMTLCLTSALAYSGYSAVNPQSMVDDQRNQPLAFNQDGSTITPRIAADVDDSARKVAIGDSPEQVLSALGQPTSIDATKTRWTYGSKVMLFKNDQLAGCVKLDRMHSSQMDMGKSIHQAPRSAPSRKLASAGYRSHTVSSKRNGTRYSAPSTSNKSVTIWRPMFQLYYSDRPLARNASPATRGFGNNPLRTGSFYQRPFDRR